MKGEENYDMLSLHETQCYWKLRNINCYTWEYNSGYEIRKVEEVVALKEIRYLEAGISQDKLVRFQYPMNTYNLGN